MTTFDPQILCERAGALTLIVAIAGGIFGALLDARWKVVVAMIAVAIAALAPIRGLSATDYLFSAIGPLSGASLVLLAIGITDGLLPEKRVSETLRTPVLALIILLGGVPLYTMALGAGSFDPYRLGFGGWHLPLGLGVLLVLGFLARSASVAAWLSLSGALYLVGAYASHNLVDYLVDPVAMVIAFVILVGALIRHRSESISSRQ